MRENKNKGKDNMLSLFLCLFVCVDRHLAIVHTSYYIREKNEKCYKEYCLYGLSRHGQQNCFLVNSPNTARSQDTHYCSKTD